ncbi:MAG: TIGR03752 family integrating conjugative element protein [Gammaproteobacteria bacterium]
METRANPVPYILAGVLVLMAVVVGFKGCRGDEPKTRQAQMRKAPEAPPADADTPADTIRTLRAGVADMTHKFTAMSDENRRLLEQNQSLERKVNQVQNQVTVREGAQQRSESTLHGLSRRIEDLSGGLRSLQAKTPMPSLRGVGLSANPEAVVWIEPVGLPMALAASQARAEKPGGEAKPDPKKEKPPLKPVYTVPENSALTGSTAFTALVGRIPIRGRIQDPFPFYVLVGPDNLAANGLELPEVAGVIFRGTALGDWNLSCVRGRLISATFIFKNGTIRTVRGSEQEPLGELADPFGVPCVSGRRITDAASYLSQRVLVSAVGAAGDAAAAAQGTNTISGLTGTGTSTVTGDVGKFIVGRTVRESAQDIEDWLDDRYADSFDAIFTVPGSTVSLLIQRELSIDYDPIGRKVRHANNIDPYRRSQLD